ncbi:hypothetical protein BLNAU_22112 [Blattamonas nauphoetae]|uniref:Uncharacterized protein n=1 Tax=Blattamonas nauphoetae TaxID=2049346 RepID=A0ABQ9WTW2_9EUKA|nr:hypothetical protein BLNAU_22112 [Blattamonas nauphoetae]
MHAQRVDLAYGVHTEEQQNRLKACFVQAAWDEVECVEVMNSGGARLRIVERRRWGSACLNRRKGWSGEDGRDGETYCEETSDAKWDVSSVEVE